MLIATVKCDWKCCKEAEIDKSVCQNSSLARQPNIEIPVHKIYERYINNLLSEAIVIAGLEPFLQFNDIKLLIDYFRNHDCLDDFVIYTGYKAKEIGEEINELQQYLNIIIKFGRYIPNQNPIFDKVLQVELASNNQYAIRIS